MFCCRRILKANNKVHPIKITTEDFSTVDIPGAGIEPLIAEGKLIIAEGKLIIVEGVLIIAEGELIIAEVINYS